MSLFICAHGELYSKCPHCNDFEPVGNASDDAKNETERDVFFDIVRSIKREEVDY